MLGPPSVLAQKREFKRDGINCNDLPPQKIVKLVMYL